MGLFRARIYLEWLNMMVKDGVMRVSKRWTPMGPAEQACKYRRGCLGSSTGGLGKLYLM